MMIIGPKKHFINVIYRKRFKPTEIIKNTPDKLLSEHELEWGGLEVISDLYLSEFTLKESLSQEIPDLLNPRVNLYLFLVIWDYKHLLRIMPWRVGSLMGQWKLKFDRRNTRKLNAGKQVLFFRNQNQQIYGALNLLMFLYKSLGPDNSYLEIKRNIRASEFYSLILRLRKGPNHKILLQLGTAINFFNEQQWKYNTKKNETLLLLWGDSFISKEELVKPVSSNFFSFKIETKSN